MSAFTLREMTPADSAALAVLTEESPDGGKIAFSPRFHVPAYTSFETRTLAMAGVVAEAGDADGVVGSGRVSFGECWFEGAVRPYALLSSLIVHPTHRKRGIARALAEWRIARAMEYSGPETLILADIQTGNSGSLANATKWATQIGGLVKTIPVPMSAKPPRPMHEVTIRAPTADELADVAAQLNDFHAGYNFHRPQTAASLDAWLKKTPFTDPINHYRVAVDGQNRLLAGMGIKEEGRLMSLHISHAPALIRLANLVLKVIPPDNEMRNLQVDKLWYASEQLDAARHLWQTVRHEFRERGSSLVVNYDPRGPIPQVIQTPFWMPTTSVTVAVRSSVRMREETRIAPLI